MQGVSPRFRPTSGGRIKAKEKMVMQPNALLSNPLASQLIQLGVHSTGQFTAQVPGVAGLSVTAPTREEAIDHLRCAIVEWLASGRLVGWRCPLYPRHSNHLGQK